MKDNVENISIQRAQWLLVEDNRADATLLLMMLDKAANAPEVRWITNGEDAINFVHQQESFNGRPLLALAIVDLNIPRRDGFEILAALRSHPDTQNVPVAVLTSSNREEDIARVKKYDQVTFITKPKQLCDYERIALQLCQLTKTIPASH